MDARQEPLLTKEMLAERENDILSYHMNGVIKENPHLLYEMNPKYSGICFECGMLEDAHGSDEYLVRRETMEKSYFGDEGSGQK